MALPPMMTAGWASAVIALSSAVLAGYAFAIGERRHRHQEERDEAADKRAKDADARAGRQERREEERTKREELELTASRSGQPTTDPVMKLPGIGRGYRFHVKNVGRAHIIDLEPRLIDTDGEVCSIPGDWIHRGPDGQEIHESLQTYLPSLAPNESIDFTLIVAEPIDRDPLSLKYEWSTPGGPAGERVSRVRIPTYAVGNS